MEKIKVDVQWCDKNFGASFGDNVPGTVVLTAKTFEELKREVPETLKFHVEGMIADGGCAMATMSLSTICSMWPPCFAHTSHITHLLPSAMLQASTNISFLTMPMV